ncbi:hypothetical protein Taro_027209 [Colocasia esculenta]|uniref:Uncharacterized protein n=1 Tax=Colocasia esculenta TaxID=4460 RepID=A0A843VF73_COLES|nr:hypothetical protein [Colocasia esculenta]
MLSEQVTLVGDRTCCSVTSRVVSWSEITVLVRELFIAVRQGKAADLLGGTPYRNLIASDHGSHTMEVFEPAWRGRALR